MLQNATSVLLINAIYQVLQPLHSLTLMLQSPKMLLTEVPLRVRNVSSTLGPTCTTLGVSQFSYLSNLLSCHRTHRNFSRITLES